MTRSPSRRIVTSSPSKRNSFGSRTACERPFQNNLARCALESVGPLANGGAAVSATLGTESFLLLGRRSMSDPSAWYLSIYTMASDAPTSPYRLVFQVESRAKCQLLWRRASSFSSPKDEISNKRARQVRRSSPVQA
jgi:hypothetical protein